MNDKPAIQPGFQKEEAKKISILINSAYYFIECVYILILPGSCRLIVLHNGRVLTDRTYKTLKGARVAFTKMYKKKAWREGVKAEWSHLYDPEIKWLDEKTKAVGE